MKWCMKCQERPCIGVGCKKRYSQLSRFGFLSATTIRSDAEEKEVHGLKVELAEQGVDTGWPILGRDSSSQKFYNRLRLARKESGLSIRGICALARVPKSSYVLWEANRADPSRETVGRLAAALRVSAAWLAYGTPVPVRKPIPAIAGCRSLVLAGSSEPKAPGLYLWIDDGGARSILYFNGGIRQNGSFGEFFFLGSISTDLVVFPDGETFKPAVSKPCASLYNGKD